MTDLADRIDAAWEGRADDPAAVEEAIDLLDRGEIRLAEPPPAGDGPWTVHAWIQRAILLYFRQRQSEPIEVGPFAYYDKVPLKQDPAAAGIRVVPPATVRRGAYVERGAVLMPSYVNIGARVGSGHHGRHLGHDRLGRPDRPGRARRRRRGHRRGPRAARGAARDRRGRRLPGLAGHRGRGHASRPRGGRGGQHRARGRPPTSSTSPDRRPARLEGPHPARAVVIPGTRQREFPRAPTACPARCVVGYRRSPRTARPRSTTPCASTASQV